MNNATALSTAAPAAVGSVIGHNLAMENAKITDAQKEAIAKVMTGLADKLSDVVDDEVNSLIVSIEQSKKDVMTGPFRIYKWAMTHVLPEKLALFPVPGTDWQTSEQPDKYDEVYYRDGKKKFRATSFYLRFFLSNFPEGKRIAAALAHVALAKDEKANQAAVPEEIRKLNPLELETLREDLIYQQNTGVAAFRDAMKLMKQFDAVNALPKVEAKPLLDKDGNVQRVNKPILVTNVDNPLVEYGLYSIAGFMQFDAADAAEKGGTLDALKLTAKRDQGEEDQGGDVATSDAPVSINTNKTFIARLGDVHEYASNKLLGEESKERYGMFLKELNSAGSDEVIEMLDDLRSFCTRVLSIPTIAGRLEAIANKPAKGKAA